MRHAEKSVIFAFDYHDDPELSFKLELQPKILIFRQGTDAVELTEIDSDMIDEIIGILELYREEFI